MKILILSQYFWPENFRINEIAKALQEKSIDVEVLTGKPNYPDGLIFEGYGSIGIQKEIYEGMLIHRIPLIARGSGGTRLAINYLSFVFSGLVFAPWLLRRNKYEVIFVYGVSPIIQAIPAILLGWMKRVPVILWVQDIWPESLSATGYVKNKFFLKIIEHIVRFIYRHVDMLLVQSEAFIKPVSELASDTPVKYYPNSVDARFLSINTSATPVIQGLDHGFSVMFAGNIGSAQAVEVIVDAASLLHDYSDIHFIVLGDGSRRNWMLKEVKSRGLNNLHLPGRFPVETMPGLMQKASILLATLADRAVFAATVPSKVQAYMAAGRPIIACMNGEGARLVLQSGSGLAVNAEDSKGLAEAIIKLYLTTKSEREEMGNKGHQYYKMHFNHATLMNDLIAHFDEVRQKKRE